MRSSLILLADHGGATGLNINAQSLASGVLNSWWGGSGVTWYEAQIRICLWEPRGPVHPHRNGGECVNGS
jgi:hypothetical protein